MHRAGQSLLFLLFMNTLAVHAEPTAVPATGFLDDDAVRSILIGHSLRGRDWIEFYFPDGTLVGKVHYFGTHSYTGKWLTRDGEVCYRYSDPRANTCSWLRRNGDRVTHHLPDGRLKKDGDALRMEGNRVDAF